MSAKRLSDRQLSLLRHLATKTEPVTRNGWGFVEPVQFIDRTIRALEDRGYAEATRPPEMGRGLEVIVITDAGRSALQARETRWKRELERMRLARAKREAGQ